jgi:imidazolonepropionase-like amidohydrolase
MPGLIDAHTHLTIIDNTPGQTLQREWTYIGAAAGRESELMLMRGFTTVRDAGGPATGLRKAIDDGRAIGPRILASGALISMTSGHGDFSDLTEPNTTLTGNIPRMMELGYTFIVDGPDAARAAVRQNMRVGASYTKILVDGGVVSEYDPLGVNQFSPEELRAIVEETNRWGTYVTAHAFSDSAVRHAIDAGVKVIEHGPMITEDTVKLMKKKEIWFSTQLRGGQTSPEEYGLTGEGATKMQAMLDAAQVMIAAIKKHNLRPAFGSDFYGPTKFAIQSEEFQARINDGFSSPEILIQATSHNAKFLEMSGDRHPYREGPLGVIEEGAYADILIVDGNPLENAAILGDYEYNIKIIMKDGKIYKNTL